MRLSKDTISKRYAEYDPRAIEFLLNIFEDVKSQNSNITNYFLVTFDLLANQLKLYFMALDALDNEKTLATKDNYQRIAKSPHIMVLNKAHQEILKILDEFNLSPFGQAKLKRIQKEDDDETANDLINKLINE